MEYIGKRFVGVGELASTQFINELRQADSEKRIEAIYHEELRKGIGLLGGRVQTIKTMYETDGVLDGEFDFDGTTKVFRIIIETKKDESFSNDVVRCRVLAQVIYYLKKFEDAGDEIPNIIFVGDRDECFVVHSNFVQDYLSKPYDWSIASSKAGILNPDLVRELVADDKLSSECFIYVIDDNFDFSEVMSKVHSLALEIKMHVRITERSISKVFDYFSMRVLRRKATGESRYTAREQVEYFMQLVLNQNDCYLHPRRKNKAVLNGVEVDVDTQAFESFINHYEFNYNAEEKKDFTAIADRLIEDSDRRRKGDFYTPSIWVDEAHKMLSENLGVNWRDEYMVWDCAWGTGNLTRDYRFWELYCSTLHEHDLKIGEKYNQDATKFQYDFLNDDVELFDELLAKVQQGNKLTERDFYGSKLWASAPSLIRGMLSGKKLLFFINPPYGGTGSMTSKTGRSAKVGVTKNSVDTLMKGSGFGGSNQLYIQFLYRIFLFKNLFNCITRVALFSPVQVMNGSRFEKLRDLYMTHELGFVNGFMFQASQFADVASNWAIAFTLWGDGVSDHILTVKDLGTGGVLDLGKHKVKYLPNDLKALKWIKTDERGLVFESRPIMTNAINLTEDSCMVAEDALCISMMDMNIVESNGTRCILAPSKTRAVWSVFNVVEENFLRFTSFYSARRLITGVYATWVNSKDEYMIPNTKHPLYLQWESDSIIYSLFNTASNQTSLRGVPCEGREVDIHNRLFFMSKEEMTKLALGESPNDDVYHDIQRHANDDRFVYKKLQEVTLSPDAQAVLDKARQLVKDSFKYRDLFNQEHPEYHINTWDAGWYQIKGLLKAYMPEELKIFNELYKEFENRMRPLVVELGFLYDYPGYEEERKKYLGDIAYDVPNEESEQEGEAVVRPTDYSQLLGNLNQG